MKCLLILGIVLLVFYQQIIPTTPSLPVEVLNPYGKLIVCTNYSETVDPANGTGSSTDDFIKALLDAGRDPEIIIYTTTSLVHNVRFCQKFIQDFATLDLPAIKQQYEAYYKQLGQDDAKIELYRSFCKALVAGDLTRSRQLYDEVQNAPGNSIVYFKAYVACHFIKFDQWAIFQTDEMGYYCLLVSKQHMGGAALATPSAGEKLSDRELKIGLKVDHLKLFDVMAPFAKKTEGPGINTELQYIAFTSIFVTTDEYKKYAKLSQERTWVIVFDGHGDSFTQGQIGRVAGTDTLLLARFLLFFEQHMVVIIVSFYSCYSAGLNLEQIIDQVNNYLNEEKRVISFIITSNALSENVTKTASLRTVEITSSGIQVIGTLDYVNYFKAATAPRPDFTEMTNYLAQYMRINPETGQPEITDYFNIPKIVIAGTLSTPIDIRGSFASIDETIVKFDENHRVIEQPINIGKRFGSGSIKPNAILLHLVDNPPLIIDYLINAVAKPTAPVLLSIVSGDAIHFIRKIEDKLVDQAAFLEIFAYFPPQSVKKIIWIETLETQTDTLKDVIFYNKPLSDDLTEQSIYYTKNGSYITLTRQVKGSALIPSLMDFKQMDLKESYIPMLQKDWDLIKAEKYAATLPTGVRQSSAAVQHLQEGRGQSESPQE